MNKKYSDFSSEERELFWFDVSVWIIGFLLFGSLWLGLV